MNTPPNLSPDQTPQGWNAAVDKYEVAAGPFTSQFAKDTIHLAKVNPEHRVLDVAAGPGVLTLAAARLWAEVVGIDFSEAISRLRERLTEENLTNASIEAMDGQALVFPDEFLTLYFPRRNYLPCRQLVRAVVVNERQIISILR